MMRSLLLVGKLLLSKHTLSRRYFGLIGSCVLELALMALREFPP